MSQQNAAFDADLSAISYFCLRKMYFTAQKLCDGLLKRRTSDPKLIFFRSFCLANQGKTSEALRGFEEIIEKRDLVLACPAAMIYVHERCRVADSEAIQELQAKLTIVSSSSTLTDMSLVMAGLFYFHIEAYDEARNMLKKLFDARDKRNSAGDINQATSSLFAFATVLMGWVDMKCDRDSYVSKSIGWFDKVLETSPRDLDALFGRLFYLRFQRRQLTPALDITSQIIVYFPSFVPAYVERMYVLLELGAWDQVLEAAQRLSSVLPDSIDSATTLCLVEICKDGRLKTAASQISALNQLLARYEPDPKIFFKAARSFSRISSHSPTILNECGLLISKAIELQPDNCDYKTELGFIQLSLGETTKARECFRSVISKSSNHPLALQGLIRCLILEGDYETAEEQLEFFEALHSGSPPPEVSYLLALIAQNKYKNPVKQLQLLKNTFNSSRKNANQSPLSLDFYYEINPDLLLDIAKVVLNRIPQVPRKEGEEPSPLALFAVEVLEEILKFLPGSIEATFQLAKIKFLSGEAIAAQGLASKCLRFEPSFLQAHMLLSEIYSHLNQPKLSLQSLEMGLSYNFEARNMPKFHLLKAKALKTQGQLEEALQILSNTMKLPGVRDYSFDMAEKSDSKMKDFTLNGNDYVTLYLELADTHSKLQHTHEATKLIEDAMRIFRGRPEYERLTLANADLLVDSGEVEQALSLLNNVSPDQRIFVDAKRRQADIYLKQKNDKKLYAKCYSEIIEYCQTPETYLLLGDAYMNIQEPKKAIEIYERALDLSPKDTSLASKLGRALIKVHDYQEAIKYYEGALSNDSALSGGLRYDLAELYIKLKQYADAERIIFEGLEHEGDESLFLEQDVGFHQLLAKANTGLGAYEKSVASLIRAKEIQQRLLLSDSSNSETSAQKMKSADICFQIAEIYAKNMKEMQLAIEYYNEAVQFNSIHTKSMLALAKIYLHQGDLNAAQNQCAALLRLDPNSEDATLMIADIMFRKNSLSSAVFHFRQLIEKNPQNYKALRQLIEMMRRAGKLEDVEKFFELPNEALKEFNACRRDTEWGEESLNNMIEIFLNPDNETLGGDALDAVADESVVSNTEKTDSEILAVLTADKLIKELPQNPKSLKTQIYECYALMGTKQRQEIERALNRFTEILNVEKDNVPALLGVAVAHMLLKQPPRARNQLKRIAKMDWEPENEFEFERAWLLLADIHIQGGKFDLATELLKKVLNQNKSCAKAWEYMGYIMEKEASYKDAAEHYESAWKLERETNPSTGYKLAFNYLKAKKNVEAIEICHKILSMYPEYPKIRKEVLEKARGMLRI
ncbi:Tetratricopeptide repeat protein 21B [Phlyctochytrium planicorne]|nr:Tetratricopeptide repeat protein 21B [Phlyctochytrium planicorne]